MKTCHSAGYFKQLILFLLLSLITLLGAPGNVLALTGNHIDRCSDCHGDRATNDVRPLDGVRNSTTGAVAGNHRTHVGPGATVDACGRCHVVPNTMYHRNGKIDFPPNINSSNLTATYLKAIVGPTPFVNQTSVPTTTNAKCSNVNCHFESTTPGWGSLSSSLTCTSCHNGFSQGHTKHLAKYTEPTNCSRCHPNHTTFQHATSAFNAGRGIKVNAEHAYTGSNYLFLPSQASQRVFGSCNTATCHTYNNKFTAVPVSWNGALGCNGCHPNLSGAHARHIGNLANSITYYNYTANVSVGTDSSDATRANYGFGCSNCHPVDTAKHIDGNVDVALSTVENSFDVSTKVGKLRRNSGAAAKTVNTTGSLQCDSVYCHSDGKGLTKLTPAWDQTFAGLGGDRCGYCHSNSPSGTGAHAAHVVGIHYDDIFNGTSGTLSAGSNTAISVSHGVATQATTLNCDICHAATVTNSRNLLNTACVSCHSTATDQAAIKRPLLNVANHVKGAPIIAFKDTTFTSKAQLRAGSFLNYTGGIAGWKRNAVSGVDQYKNGAAAYDISKNRLTIINWDSTAKSCSNVVCHNQKPGQSVKWTDSLDCESCHKAL